MTQMELELTWEVESPTRLVERARVVRLMARCILAVAEKEEDGDDA